MIKNRDDISIKVHKKKLTCCSISQIQSPCSLVSCSPEGDLFKLIQIHDETFTAHILLEGLYQQIFFDTCSFKRIRKFLLKQIFKKYVNRLYFQLYLLYCSLLFIKISNYITRQNKPRYNCGNSEHAFMTMKKNILLLRYY